MLEQSDTLLTIAEIAVAFAGFASIVSVVGRSAGATLAVTFRWPLRGMIACSLVVVFGALFPLIPDHFGLSVAATWRCSGVFLAMVSSVLFVGGVRDAGMVAQSKSLPGRIAWLLPVLVTIGIGFLIGLQLVTTFLAGWFLLALLSLLALSGLLFGYIVMAYIAPR